MNVAPPDRWAEVLPPEPAPPSMRVFGLVMWIGFSLIGILLTWRAGWVASPVGWGLYGLGTALLVWSLVHPGSLRPVHDGWMRLGELLGAAVSGAVLTLMYLLVVTPLGLLMRATGTDPLARRRPAAGSAWHRLPAPPADHYEHLS